MVFSLRILVVISLVFFAGDVSTAPTHARHLHPRATRHEGVVQASYNGARIHQAITVSARTGGKPNAQPLSSHLEHWGLTDDEQSVAGAAQDHHLVARRGENKVRPLEWQMDCLGVASSESSGVGYLGCGTPTS